jgi:NAD+ diphosphatase
MTAELNYCPQCGTKLIMKYLPTEGKEIQYCETCGDFRFPIFSAAVSMVVESADRGRILLIRQYGRPSWILPAGYINKGEDAEDAVKRELMEELGLETEEIRFNRTRYYPPSNVLMLNYTARVKDMPVNPNWEVDEWQWFTREEARRNIRQASLAEQFLTGYLDRPKTEREED